MVNLKIKYFPGNLLPKHCFKLRYTVYDVKRIFETDYL